MKKFYISIVLLVLILSSACAFDLDVEKRHTMEFKSSINSIKVEWSSDEVKIGYHDDDCIRVTEFSDRKISDKKAMICNVAGDTLEIKRSKSKISIFGNSEKKLVVLIPRGKQLENLIVSVASADIEIGNMGIRNLSFSTSSGDVELSGIEADKIRVSTSSGDVELSGIEADEIRVSTASGGIEATRIKASDIDIGVSSGEVELAGIESDRISVGSASGEVELSFIRTPQNLKIHTASGEVKLSVPDSKGFTAKVDTASGKLSCDFPVVMGEKKTYVYGDGSSKFDINTASGNVTIKGY